MGIFWGGVFGSWVVVYANMLRKVPIFYRPWEFIAVSGTFAWLGYRMDRCNVWLEERVMMEAMRRIDHSRGKLDDQYRILLGAKYYDKWFPDGVPAVPAEE